MSRKLSKESLSKPEKTIKLFKQVLKQKRGDKNNIYSLHAPEVGCIAKGKEHRKYEFGSKVSFGIAQRSNVILSAVNFKGNPNDNKTLEKTLDQQERMTGVRAKKAYVDRGYKGREISGTKVEAPGNGIGKTKAEKRKLRKSFRRQAAIEPIIGHTKSDFGLGRNYLKGEVGDAINAMLAASAFNFRGWMRKAIAQVIFVLNDIKQIWQQFPTQSKIVAIV